MKKRFSILLIVALVLILGACNSSPDNKQPSAPIVKPGVLDPNDPYYADDLNDYGLPDLSFYTVEQIVDMYVNPDNWSASVLYATDGYFSYDEDEVYSDSDIDEDYVFAFGEWVDYDPGTWTPGPDEITQFDIDWSDFEDPGEYTPPSNELPAEYSFLVPGGVRSGDMVINDEDGLNISLKSRTADEYNAIVQAAQSHGYTIDANSGSFGGMQYFEASNGTEEISIVFQNGSVMISFDEVDE